MQLRVFVLGGENMTLEEYVKKNNVTINAVSKETGINCATLWNIYRGGTVFPKTKAKLKTIGIETELDPRFKNKKPKKLDTKMVKEFHLVALKEFGNTVISNTNDIDDIIECFRLNGFNVTVRECDPSNYDVYDSLYVVELVKEVRGEDNDTVGIS